MKVNNKKQPFWMKPDFIRFIAPLRVIAVLYGLASSVNRTSVKMLCDIQNISNLFNLSKKSKRHRRKHFSEVVNAI